MAIGVNGECDYGFWIVKSVEIARGNPDYDVNPTFQVYIARIKKVTYHQNTPTREFSKLQRLQYIFCSGRVPIICFPAETSNIQLSAAL